MESQPLHFTAAGIKPPTWESPAVPVSGLLVVTHIRLCPLIGVPVRGETEKISMLSGDNGSTWGSISLSMIYMPSADPPGYFL